jgi:hypothetical protein
MGGARAMHPFPGLLFRLALETMWIAASIGKLASEEPRGAAVAACGLMPLSVAQAVGAVVPYTELVLVMLRAWRSLHAWLPHLRKRAGALPWLVVADLPLAGLFFPPHEAHRCGLLSPCRRRRAVRRRAGAALTGP